MEFSGIFYEIITSTDFTGIAPQRVSTSSGKKSVSHYFHGFEGSQGESFFLRVFLGIFEKITVKKDKEGAASKT